MGFSSPVGASGQGPALQRGRSIRVMVVDDSLIVRAAFSRLIDQEPDLELAAAVSTAEDALALLDADGAAATALKTIKGNQDARA